MINTIILIIEIGILYTIGGNGYKWVRRYGIPIVLIGATGSVWVGVLAWFAFIQPYGDDEKLITNIFTAISHAIISIPLGFGIWNPITFIVIMAVMYPLSKRVWWTYLEILMGIMVGIQVLCL